MRVIGTSILAGLALVGLAASSQAAESTDWPYYANQITGERYSALKEITPENAGQLKQACIMDLGDPGPFQGSPLIVGGVIYVTTGYTTTAFDGATCERKWQNVYKPEGHIVYTANRGLAYLDGTLYRGTMDARLVAIDAATGKTKWVKKAGNPDIGEFFSSAPLAWEGMVFMGPAGSDWGIRGHVMAFDAETGEEKWRFWTIPGEDDPGGETWHNPASIKRGGGGQWTSYTLDPETGELFVPVANPSPDFAPQYRPGDNLYTNSIISLDAKTGKLNWYYQFTPADGFDYDQGAAPALFTDAEGRKIVAAGSKDGNLYAVDRDSKKLLYKRAVTTIKEPPHYPDEKGVYACPGALGGVEWNGPAYYPPSNLLLTGAVDWCMTFTTDTQDPNETYKPGHLFYGTDAKPPKEEPATGWITAVDASTGEVKWQKNTTGPVTAAVNPTAGGVVFTGDLDGNFLVLNAETGETLFEDKTGGGVAGGVPTYAIGGKQYVAVTSGNISRGTFGALGKPKVIVYALGVEGEPKTYSASTGDVVEKAQGAPGPDEAETAAASKGAPNVANGNKIYSNYCAGCHGEDGEGGVGPSLIDEFERKNMAEIVDWIEHPNSPMPKLYPGVITVEQVRDVGAYVEETFRKKKGAADTSQ